MLSHFHWKIGVIICKQIGAYLWNVININYSVFFLNDRTSHDIKKSTKWLTVRQAKTQTRLMPRLIIVFAVCIKKAWVLSATHWAHREDSDQTGRMPRLIWVFAGRTLILLVLSCRGSNVFLFALSTTCLPVCKMCAHCTILVKHSHACHS